MLRYRVMIDGEYCGISRDFDNSDGAAWFARELLKCNEAKDYPVEIRVFEDEYESEE